MGLKDKLCQSKDVLLLSLLDEIMPDFARMNSVKAESIKSKIKADPFIKREDVLNVEFMENLK